MCAVPNMAVFCSSLTSCFPGMLLIHFLNDFEIVPVAPIITDIAFVFTFHMRCISIVRSLYFRIFSASFLITFLSPGIATSINIYVPFSLSRIIMSGLLLGIVLSVCISWFHNMVTLPPWLVSTDFGTCSYYIIIIIIITRLILALNNHNNMCAHLEGERKKRKQERKKERRKVSVIKQRFLCHVLWYEASRLVTFVTLPSRPSGVSKLEGMLLS